MNQATAEHDVAVAPLQPIIAVPSEQAAAAIGVSVSTLKRLVSAGEITPLKILGATRYSVRHLEDYVARKVAEAQAEALPAADAQPAGVR